MAKESEGALFSVQNVSTACTRGVLEYIEVQPERKILHAKNAFLVCNSDKILNLNGDNIEVVDRFSYLGDVLSMEGGAQEAVTSRIRLAWRKFKEGLNVQAAKSLN